MNSGLTLNFNAIAPNKYKRSVVTSFVHRIYNACSKWSHFHTSMQRACGVLYENCYPKDYVLSTIKTTLDSILKPKQDKLSAQKNRNKFMEDVKGKMLFHIQYRGLETQSFMRKLISNNVPVIPVYTTKKLRYVLPSLKQNIAKEMRSQVVYKIECPKCLDYYVGMTFRHLGTRISEHFKSSGTMTKHTEECGLKFDPL